MTLSQTLKHVTNSVSLRIDFAVGDEKILVDYAITHTTIKYAVGKNGLIVYKGSGVFGGQQWETLLSGLANS